jgi:hypothetical protein
MQQVVWHRVSVVVRVVLLLGYFVYIIRHSYLQYQLLDQLDFYESKFLVKEHQACSSRHRHSIFLPTTTASSNETVVPADVASEYQEQFDCAECVGVQLSKRNPSATTYSCRDCTTLMPLFLSDWMTSYQATVATHFISDLCNGPRSMLKSSYCVSTEFGLFMSDVIRSDYLDLPSLRWSFFYQSCFFFIGLFFVLRRLLNTIHQYLFGAQLTAEAAYVEYKKKDMTNIQYVDNGYNQLHYRHHPLNGGLASTVVSADTLFRGSGGTGNA